MGEALAIPCRLSWWHRKGNNKRVTRMEVTITRRMLRKAADAPWFEAYKSLTEGDYELHIGPYWVVVSFNRDNRSKREGHRHYADSPEHRS
jgi:hypothetical protein